MEHIQWATPEKIVLPIEKVGIPDPPLFWHNLNLDFQIFNYKNIPFHSGFLKKSTPAPKIHTFLIKKYHSGFPGKK